jgi:ATP phosphoribosyltransferase regulatory subunit
MRELRTIETGLVEAFASFGFGEVRTPTIEYDSVLAGAAGRGVPSAYRFFDERGQLLALRSDMTLPVARMVANRFTDLEPPFRLCYVGSAYRGVRPQRGQMREFRQAGVELLGVPAPEGTAEIVEVLEAALDAVGLPRTVVGLGDADVYRNLLDAYGVPAERGEAILDRLAFRDFVGLEIELGETPGLDEGACEALLKLPRIRGGADQLAEARELGGEATMRATERLAQTFAAIEARGVAERVRVDLGLLRDIGYYTGAILEVYDPALGHVLGGGGRYDELMAQFGRPMPAVGFGLYVERLHIAQAEEERLSQRGVK